MWTVWEEMFEPSCDGRLGLVVEETAGGSLTLGETGQASRRWRAISSPAESQCCGPLLCCRSRSMSWGHQHYTAAARPARGILHEMFGTPSTVEVSPKLIEWHAEEWNRFSQSSYGEPPANAPISVAAGFGVPSARRMP